VEATIFLPSLNLSTLLFTRRDDAQWLCQLNTVTFRGNVPIRAVGVSKTYKDIAFYGAFLRGSMWPFCDAIRRGQPRTKKVLPNGIRLN
jgi:hypothetical protein